MRPCKGECGLFVVSDGDQFCTSCQIKRDAETRRQSIQAMKVRRTFALLSFRVTVVGFDTSIAVDDETNWSAAGLRSLATLLTEAADYLAGLAYEWKCELCDAPCNFACHVCETTHPKPRCPACYRLGHERGAL